MTDKAATKWTPEELEILRPLRKAAYEAARRPLPKKSIEVLTGEFRASHGRSPSGRGFWWFASYRGDKTFSHNGLYSGAKKAAIAWAAEQRIPTISVQP